MAETSPSTYDQELVDIRKILWGDDIKADIFRRWSQGFYFSSSEPTALVQSEGGPCAIIAPVQAFILKYLLLKYKDLSFRDKPANSDAQGLLLANALTEILQQCNSEKYYIVYLDKDHSAVRSGLVTTYRENGVAVAGEVTLWDYANFHQHLRILTFEEPEDVNKYYLGVTQHLQSQFGVLLFLYSVIMTRGLEGVRSDSSNDLSEPLIDATYGYGSQSLINLAITGRATTYVWNHEQDVGGLKLQGLEKQSQIGFITTMEHLRYCTVGSFYKNPIHPVWVLGSDTHLTVLFSTERRLVCPETKSDQADRVFKHFDPDGNNFISSSLLKDVLHALDLVSDEAYVDIMKRKLDSENLGIILLNSFMDEFFPKEHNPRPDIFPIVHYNGLAQSNVDGQVKYRIGECVLLESNVRAVSESNPMLTILETKWQNIELQWNEFGIPSLN